LANALPLLEVRDRLAGDPQLSKTWILDETESFPKLMRSFVAKNFQAAMDFISQLAAIAEEEGHHPDFHLTSYRNVDISLYTHSVGGVTENDFILAARLDSVPVVYSPKWLKEHPGIEAMKTDTPGVTPEPESQTSDSYTQDGKVAKEIASVTPYFPFKKIPRFYDIGGFLKHPEIFQKVINAFFDRYKAMDIDSIGGFEARGFILGPPIALALKKPFFMLRKPGKMPNTVSSSSYSVEYGEREGMCISRDSIKHGDRVLLIDDLVATGGTLSSGHELVRHMGGEVVECACVVEIQMFVDPPESSGLPSRKKMFASKGILEVPVWGLISEKLLTLAAELTEDYKDDGEEH